MLLAGFDLPTSSPSLYWIDYLGTLATVPFAAQGYGAHFALSTMDRFHTSDMSLDEGLELLRRCIGELKQRFIVDLGQWNVRVIDHEGIRDIDIGRVDPPSQKNRVS